MSSHRRSVLVLLASLLLAGCASRSDQDNGPSGARVIERGVASWYGERFHGRRTASGERFDMHAMTAAHKTLPFGTRLKVRSVQTGQEVVVRINDRGPHTRGRIIDLSRAAAIALGIHRQGTAEVLLLRE